MKRSANFPTVLLGTLGAALLLLPAAAAAAAITSVTMSDTQWVPNATPTAFSLTPGEPRHSPARAPRAAPPQRLRLFGYPSARADEFVPPPVPAGPSLLFSHAALGVAMLDSPAAGAGGDGVATADSGHLGAAQLALTVPATTRTILPSPLPIALILALVLLPAGLVLGQALRGPSRRPHPAMRRQAASRRDSNG